MIPSLPLGFINFWLRKYRSLAMTLLRINSVETQHIIGVRKFCDFFEIYTCGS